MKKYKDYIYYYKNGKLLVFNPKIKNSNNKDLTKDEENSLTRYVSSSSYILNEAMRNNTLNDELKKERNNISNALKKLPSEKGIFNRSIFYMGNAEQNLKEILGKDIIEFNQFISAMKNEVYDDGDDMRIIIHGKSAKDISKYGSNEEKGQVLFDYKVKYRPLKKYIKDSKIYYEIEEI